MAHAALNESLFGILAMESHTGEWGMMRGRMTRAQGNMLVEVENCPIRNRCPFGMICARPEDGDDRLVPLIINIGKEEYLWTHMFSESRVFLIRSGVFASVSTVDENNEVISGFSSTGNAVGLAELFLEKKNLSMFYLRPLLKGKVCSFPSSALKQKLKSLPESEMLNILANQFFFQTYSSMIQSLLRSQKLVSDRIILLFYVLDALQGGTCELREPFALTHEEIAEIVCTDRTSVSRALRVMQQDGVIKLGRRSIAVDYKKLGHPDLKIRADVLRDCAFEPLSVK